MIAIRRYKSIHILLLVSFVVFIFDNACFAKANYPKTLKIRYEVKAKVKIKRVKGRSIPVEIKIRNRTFKISEHKGKFRFRAKTKDMTNLVPEFKDKLGTSITQLSLYQIRKLVKGDKKKGPESC